MNRLCRWFLASVAIFVLFGNGCVPAPMSPPPTNTLAPTSTPVRTSTLTPTVTPVPPTPTPTVPSKPEITPEFVQEVTKGYKNVQIHTKVISDISLDTHSTPSLTKIVIADDVLVQFIARTVFKTWWVKGNVEHSGKPTEEDFKAFMKMWVAAQKGEGSWNEVEFKVFANDLATPGYTQEQVTIWPMFTANSLVPEGVRAVSEINIVYVIGEYSINRTLLDDIFAQGLGANLDGNALNMYIIPTSLKNGRNGVPGFAARSNHSFASVTQMIPWFLINNPGRSSWQPGGSMDKQLYNLLVGGLRGHTVHGTQTW